MNNLRRVAQSFINSVTMYRMVVYALAAIIISAFVMSLVGRISYTIPRLLISLIILLPVSYGTSRLFAWTFRTKHNPESWLITSLILFCLVLPPSSAKAAISLGMIAFLATASKYILAVRGRHVFNPAAIAVVISGLIGLGYASWWIATPPLLPIILLAGSLVVWRTRRFSMVGTFVVISLVTVSVVALLEHHPVGTTLRTVISSYPLLFLATIMLTEPLTSPTTWRWQLVYAVAVGVMAHGQLAHWLTPEFALVLGNLITFGLSQKRQLRMSIESVKKVSDRNYEIILRPEHPFRWTPGQYLELFVPHTNVDRAGERRTFSIASAPSEGIIRLGITVGDQISSYKQALIASAPGTELTAALIGGDFILENDTRPLIFLAGGIGITPFRAMIAQLLAAKSQRSVSLLYFGHTEDALIWKEFFTEASGDIPLQFIPVVSNPSKTWQGETGRLSTELLVKHDIAAAQGDVYASGPPAFISSAKKILAQGDIGQKRVRTDYFSGY